MYHSGYGNILKIDHTLEVISECWTMAESNLQGDIKVYSPGAGEEEITQAFHRKFAKTLDSASKNHCIERAFLSDLNRSFPELPDTHDLTRIAQGLVADVTLHEGSTEWKTGGDLGFMIIRPQIQRSHDSLQISDYRCGILVQAKLKDANRKWGTFTPKQKKFLPQRLQYSALLLYSYKDEARCILQVFRWQLCRCASFEEVEDWRRTDSFPCPVKSDFVIRGVGNGTIGTDDDRVIDEIISPKGNRALVISIHWPDGGHPGSQVRVYSSKQDKQKVSVQVLQ